MKAVVAVATAALTLGAIVPADAGSPYTGSRQLDRRSDSTASGTPDVTDLRGCVKSCFRDQNPCDPPAFKRADGRCNLND